MIVNVSSCGTIRETMTANHSDGNGTDERFVSDWQKCLEKAQADNEWNVCYIEDAMQDLGWELKSINVVEVEY